MKLLNTTIMKKMLMLATAFTFATQLFAQNDPNAKKILDAVSNKFKTVKALQANYNLTVTTKAGKNAGTKTGTLLLKGQKFVINDKSLQIYSDGKTTWRYEPEANEVTVSPVDNNATGITPAKLFTNFYDKDFSYKLNGNKPMAGKQLAEIELTPTTKNKNYSKVYVYVDQTQNMIMSSKVVENSGNSYNYSISNLKTNVALADNQFVFDKSKHPGVEEITQ
jgi:outer membrane lipoprotein carrier protein